MRKNSLRLFCCLFLLPLAYLAVPVGVQGQTAAYPPYALYRFFMNGTNGFTYTPWYSIGANAGYTYQLAIGDRIGQRGGVYPNPNNGYTPDPSTGLMPLYQWTVYQGARSYTYLSPYYTSHGSGYYFNGVAGYVYPNNVVVDPFGFPTRKMAQWYSQTRGFWYGINAPGDPNDVELPPESGYAYQGIVCALPGPSVGTAPGECPSGPGLDPRCPGNRAALYNAPAPPPPSCDANEEQYCYDSGGSWDSASCTCTYGQKK